MNAILILLALLCGGAGYDDIHQRSKLKQANAAALQAQSEGAKATTALTSLKAAEAAQSAAQAKEDDARKAQEADRSKRGQIVQVYVGATGHALAQTPPAVDNAIKFNGLAAGAADPATPETQAAALALAQADEARQAQQIADLQTELAQVKADDEAKAVVIEAQVRDKIAATVQIGSLTGEVALHQAAETTAQATIVKVTADNNSLLSKLGLYSAQIARWIGAVVVLVLAGLLLLHLHVVLRAKHAALTVAHASLQTANETLKTAHADTLKAINLPTT